MAAASWLVRIAFCLADLRGKLVDDLVRVGWNLLSQNKSPFNAKPPQSVWIAGVEKNGEKRG